MRIKKRCAAALAVVSLLALGAAVFSPPAAGGNPTSEENPVYKAGKPSGHAAAKDPPQKERPLRVHFIDVGHGDSCLIQCPGGENILIDGGSGYNRGTQSYDPIVNRYLKSRGVQNLDLVIATHPHSDHVGGLASVLEEFPTKMVIDSGKPHTTNSYRRYLEAVKASPNTKYKLGRAGQVYKFGRVKLTLLHPGNVLLKKLNDCSIVCRLQYGKISFLFTGDAEAKAEQEILKRRYSLRSTVLKVGHHGNETSSTGSFIRAMAPRVAVISCAARKSLVYGDSKVLDRLRTGGASVYRTDECGTIIVESDGKYCNVKVLGKGE